MAAPAILAAMSSEASRRLGRFLTQRREALGLTKAEVEEQAKIGGGNLTRYEAGSIENIGPKVLKALAGALRTTVEEMHAAKAGLGSASPTVSEDPFPSRQQAIALTRGKVEDGVLVAVALEVLWVVAALALVGCGDSKKSGGDGGEKEESKGGDDRMSAKDACETLAKAVGGSNCKEGKPGGLGAAAWAKYDFDLAEPKGKGCGVYEFKKSADYEATVKAYAGAATLAGPHRYGNAEKLVFVQCNSDMPRPDGEKLETAVKKL